jgi:hypothetical protein
VTLFDAAVFLTVIVQVPVPPCVKVPECPLVRVNTGPGRTVAVSVFVEERVKPPPEMVTEF